MLSEIELAEALPQFIGTESWSPRSVLYPHDYLTDGAKFLADNVTG
jgi:hypothetical protein